MSVEDDKFAVARIADYLGERSDAIIEEWIIAVRQDPAILASDTVTELQLRDHMPQLLQDLVALLRDKCHAVQQRTREDSHLHGEDRWQYGYELSELLRELAIFRSVLMKSLIKFEEEGGHVHLSAMRPARRTVHRFIDDLARRSSVAFVEQQHAQIQNLGDSRLRLLRSVSHELRNLVNSISLVSQELAENPDPAEHRRIAGVLQESGRHMREMLDHLLELARNGEQHPPVEQKSFDPAALAAELAALYRISCQHKGLKFLAEIDPQLSEAVGDPNKVRQIANNLLNNAVKFTRTG